jgi:hypothetical protein
LVIEFFALSVAVDTGYGRTVAAASRVGFGVTWRVVAASAVGTSHAASCSACQDSFFAQVEADLNNQPVLTIFVSDGAGSALHGGIGAQLAIQSARSFVIQHYAHAWETGLNDNWAVECIQAVRAKIYDAALQQGAKARDFACTFLGVVASPVSTLLMQIGDGGIVVDVGNGLTVPITPMVGEYANMTNFVTDQNALICWLCQSYQACQRKLRSSQMASNDWQLIWPRIPPMGPSFSLSFRYWRLRRRRKRINCKPN